jgi:hypothetical protein
MEEMRNTYRILFGKLVKERDSLEYLGIDGRIIKSY